MSAFLDAVHLDGATLSAPPLDVAFGIADARLNTWTTNPATGQRWTAAEVNALRAGVEAAEVFSALHVTQVYVTVKVVDPDVYAVANGPTGMNTLTSVTRAGVTTSFTYDANGNLISKFGAEKTCYEWNPENLLARVKTVWSSCTEAGTQVQKCTYDGIGRRVKVEGTTSSTWTVSILSGADVLFETDNTGAVTKYVYANGMRIAKINPDATVHYILSDHQGSTRKILDANRVEQYSVEYEPFGKPYAASGPKPDPHKYTMEKHDDPTGLVYLRARQYDPEVGRFVSADPVLGSLSRPQTLHRFAYSIKAAGQGRESHGRVHDRPRVLHRLEDRRAKSTPEQRKD